MPKYGLSPIAISVIDKAKTIAREAETAFIEAPSLKTAARFIDSVAELEPAIFPTTNGSLEDALRVTRDHANSVQISPQAKAEVHAYFNKVAELYGLH